jgi:SAF domain-containing protein
MQNAMGSDRGPRSARRVRAVLLGLAIGLGIDLGMLIGGGLALRSWPQLAEEWARQSQRTQLAEQAQQAKLEAQQEAARPRIQAVVARTDVAAGVVLNMADFELREVRADAVLPDVLTSLDELHGKAISVPVHDGSVIFSSKLYEPAELTATPEIIAAEITPTNVKVGDVLSIKVTVKNTSSIPLRKAEPVPGFTYVEGESVRMACRDTASAHVCGPFGAPYASWRVAAASADPATRDELPYRWGLGGDLAPGATTAVTGQVTVGQYFEPRHFWLALVEEPGRVVQNGVGMTLVTSLPGTGANVPQPGVSAAVPAR